MLKESVESVFSLKHSYKQEALVPGTLNRSSHLWDRDSISEIMIGSQQKIFSNSLLKDGSGEERRVAYPTFSFSMKLLRMAAISCAFSS